MPKRPEPPEPPQQPATSPLDTMGLARAAKAGELERFTELYERIAPALMTWARLRIRPAWRAHLDEADVVQEVWCRAWRAFPDFDADRIPFRYWAFRIAKNVLLEASRKLRSGSGAPGSTTRLLLLAQVPDEATGLTQRVRRDEGLELFADWAKTCPRRTASCSCTSASKDCRTPKPPNASASRPKRCRSAGSVSSSASRNTRCRGS